MRYRNHEKHRSARYLSLGILFIICVSVFAARLIYYQIAVRDTYAVAVIPDGTIRTVTVQAQRGNICDRNGTVLVKNSFTYDLQIEYGALPESRAEAYDSYLGVLDLLTLTNTPRASELSPFEGSYPEYSYNATALDPDSDIHTKLLHVLEQYFVGSNGYASADEAFLNVTASQLAEYIAKTFDIVTEKKDGTISTAYKNTDIDSLIALRYNMAATEFGVLTPYILATEIDERLVSAVSERHLTGITVSVRGTRVYNYLKPDGGRYASHILGTIGSITAETGEYYTDLGYRLDAKVGRSGCELAFEEYLHGVDGTLAIVEDGNGNITDTYWIKEPVAGRDVWLTIDIAVQMTAEDSLSTIIAEQGSVGGAVAATDPNNGEILALASSPNGELNRAISAYEPGSTFKVGVALAALNEGYIESYTNIATLGSYNGMKCSHYTADGYCCGSINVEKAIERSCNYFFAKLGDDLGIEKITEYASLYGFGQATGIEIGINASESEAMGRISDELDYMTAIGQLSSCTPLQISQYISMIANGGTRYSAHLLKFVREYDTGKIVYEKANEVLAILSSAGISDSDIVTVRRGMYGVVNGSDASSYVSDAFRSAGYSVAGKTGTAEVGLDEIKKHNALFVGYAPYENPKIVVTCFIEQGDTGGMASGVVRDVMDAYSENVSQLSTGVVPGGVG